jgi:ADP-heptose:LPS heptosyltransferase
MSARPSRKVVGAAELPWLNPVGGLGDTLMLAGVLKQVVDRDPSRRFNLVTRTKYPPLLRGHPAIARVGHPPSGAVLVHTDYWHDAEFGRPEHRAYQILARMLGLATPAPEELYVPWPTDEEDPVLFARIPWQRRNVLLGPTSESPRKLPALPRWEAMVAALRGTGVGVVQVGRDHDPYVRGAFDLRGLTTPRQAIGLVHRFDAVLTVDSFLMHAAHLCGARAVVLWGPTDHRVYGYAEQIHLQAPPCPDAHACIAPGNSQVYATDCPKGEAHCLDGVPLEAVLDAVQAALAAGAAPPRRPARVRPASRSGPGRAPSGRRPGR